MGDVTELQRKLLDLRKSLYKEGFLGDQFKQLRLLQVRMEFVIHIFFEDTEKAMGELAKTLSPESQDFEKMDSYLHQLDGYSCSVGAERVHKAVITFRKYCTEKNIDRCLKCLQELENEYSLVKEKLETMFELEKQVLATAGSHPKQVLPAAGSLPPPEPAAGSLPPPEPAAGSLPPPDIEKETKKQ